jgi:hypothetical protein
VQRPTHDQLLTSAVRFLIDGEEEEAATVLRSCSLNLEEDWYDAGFGEGFTVWFVTLTGPRAAYDILCEEEHSTTEGIRRALQALLSTQEVYLSARAEVLDIDPDWRSELLEIARGRGVHNQAIEAKPPWLRIWNNLRFRSESEKRIAQALDRAGVLFLPNCLARLGSLEKRKNREADFLICHDGKWGILEVDGEPFHPPSRTMEDHGRDRLFHDHGILVIQHFDATECYENPDSVVKQFLNLLKKT